MNYRSEAQKNKALDQTVEVIVVGSLLSLLLLLGTPLLGKLVDPSDGPTLKVIRESSATQRP